MKWNIEMYVAGNLFTEQVQAANRQDAIETAKARNPKAKVVSTNPSYK